MFDLPYNAQFSSYPTSERHYAYVIDCGKFDSAIAPGTRNAINNYIRRKYGQAIRCGEYRVHPSEIGRITVIYEVVYQGTDPAKFISVVANKKMSFFLVIRSKDNYVLKEGYGQ